MASISEQILTLHKMGYNCREIAQELGLTYPKTRYIGIEMGICWHRPVWREEQVEKMRKMILDGRNSTQIAKEFAVSRDTVNRVIYDYNLPHPHYNAQIKWTPERIAEVMGLYNCGCSLADIATSLGLTPSGLYQAIHRSGITLKKHKTKHNKNKQTK